MGYDVVIAGASIAGCTAATMFGRAGLRVALLERNRSVSTHKALCGHFILGGTKPTLERLGLWSRMVDAGAATSAGLGVWNGTRWIAPGPDATVPAAISLRRSKLDPLLRAVAAETPGVDLLMAHTVTGVLQEGPAITGLIASTPSGQHRELRGRLVIGADGHRSTVANLAGIKPNVAPNNRFLFWAYYRGVHMRGPGEGQLWMLDPDVAVCDRTDDGLVQIGVFPSKARLTEFCEDRLGAFERFVQALPDGPDLTGAVRVSKVLGTTDYPCVRRPPVPRPGLALIGDAATASDPVPAVGCGWAFRSAEWLADATAPALLGEGDLQAALRRYRRAHRVIERYDTLARADARALPPNRVQRLIRTAAATDAEVARRLRLFSMRAGPPTVLLNPKVILRSLRAPASNAT